MQSISQRALNFALSLRSELIISSKWASYFRHCKAFSSLFLFQSWSSWKPGLPLFCIPCHISCSLLALGNNSSSLFSLFADKLLSCTLKQSWLLNGCSPKQTNSSLTSKNVKSPLLQAFLLLGMGTVIYWPHPAINPVEGDTLMVCKRLRRRNQALSDRWDFFTGVLTSCKSSGFDVIS